MTTKSKTYVSVYESDLKSPAKFLKKHLKKGGIVLLEGSLGAGKTTFVRYLAKEYNITSTSSPTFSIVNIYEGDMKIYHMDLYRLETEESLFSFDIESYFVKDDGIVLIEWPKRLGELKPENAIEVKFEFEEDGKRKVEISDFKKECYNQN